MARFQIVTRCAVWRDGAIPPYADGATRVVPSTIEIECEACGVRWRPVGSQKLTNHGWYLRHRTGWIAKCPECEHENHGRWDEPEEA